MSSERAIFISYRRADSEGEAGRLYDDLVRAYGDNSVFMDVAGIAPGLDFRQAIDSNVAGCGVLLAIIGPLWASVTDTSGSRRLEDANDYVRLEIAAALARNIPVIPVLVHEAKMPNVADLPENLKDLAYRNSVEITHARWNSDVALLTSALKSYVHVPEQAEKETVHATLPVQLPAPQSSTSPVPASRSSKPFVYAGLGLLALAAMGAGAYALLHGSSSGSPDGLWQMSAQRGGNDSLARLRIASQPDGGVSVQAWGQCEAGLCDWGTRRAASKDGTIQTEEFSPRYTPGEAQDQRGVTMTMHPAGNTMTVTVVDTFRSRDGNETKKTLQNIFNKVSASP